VGLLRSAFSAMRSLASLILPWAVEAGWSSAVAACLA